MAERFTPDEATAAIREARGLLAVAARRLGVTRTGLGKYIKRHPSLDVVIAEARATTVDLAEGKLFQAVDRGEAWAVTMVLKNLGRDRGYGDQLDIVWREEAAKLAVAYGLDPQRVIDLAIERKKRAG